MNKIKKIVAIVIAAMGLFPNSAVLAAEQNEESTIVSANKTQTDLVNETNPLEDSIKTTKTTDSAVSIKVTTTTAPSVVVVDKPIVDKPIVDFNSEYSKASKALMLFEAKNNTTTDEIVNIIKSNIDESIKVIVSKEFIKVDATASNVGYINGKVILSTEEESKELNVVLPIAKLAALQDTIVKSLSAEYTTASKNTLGLGVTKVKVKGFNAENQEVPLDESKLTYKWFLDGKVLENEVGKELEITSRMDGKKVMCDVGYPDNFGI